MSPLCALSGLPEWSDRAFDVPLPCSTGLSVVRAIYESLWTTVRLFDLVGIDRAMMAYTVIIIFFFSIIKNPNNLQ
jgi:hypothetical protein